MARGSQERMWRQSVLQDWATRFPPLSYFEKDSQSPAPTPALTIQYIRFLAFLESPT